MEVVPGGEHGTQHVLSKRTPEADPLDQIEECLEHEPVSCTRHVNARLEVAFSLASDMVTHNGQHDEDPYAPIPQHEDERKHRHQQTGWNVSERITSGFNDTGCYFQLVLDPAHKQQKVQRARQNEYPVEDHVTDCPRLRFPEYP